MIANTPDRLSKPIRCLLYFKRNETKTSSVSATHLELYKKQ